MRIGSSLWRMDTLATERVAAILLLAAGTAWRVKAGVILSTGGQPPFLLQVGQMLCALALSLLLAGFAEPRRRFVTVGAIIAGTALVATLAASLMELIPGAAVSRGDDFVFPYSALVLIGSIGIFVAMFSFGIAFGRKGRRTWKSMVPLVTGLVPVLAVATGFIHIELPILLIGFAWAAAGTVIIKQGPENARYRQRTLPDYT